MHPWDTLRLDSRDWTDAAALANAVGWHDTPEDWATLSSCATVLGLRDERSALMATAALCDFGAVVSVAKMLVHPTARGRGLARRLLREALGKRQRSDAVPVLIATELGRLVYLKEGFRDVERLDVCVGVARAVTGGGETRAVGADDLAELARLDALALGCDRRVLLETRFRQADASALLRRGGELSAAGLRVPQGEGFVIGPVLARSDEDALAVVRALLPEGRRVRVDIPARHPAVLREVLALGLAHTASRDEMTLGGVALPGERRLRYAPVALAYG